MAKIPRELWEGELRAFKCRPKPGFSAVRASPGHIAPEWWETDWGHAFPVPVVTPESEVDAEAFSNLLASLIHLRTVRTLGRH